MSQGPDRHASAVLSAGSPLPTVVVSPRAAERIRGGHPWIFREDVARDLEARERSAVDVVLVEDKRGTLLGTAIYSGSSRIALRVFSRAATPLDAQLLDERIGAAIERRQPLYPAASYDAYRVVHGEADLLPGLFIDKYADVAVVQTGCRAMDVREPAIAEILQRRLGARLVVARNDGSVRDFDDLPRTKGVIAGQGATLVAFHDAGSAVQADVLSDGKTGSFLDQQENHARAAEYVRPGAEALDAFTYHGGFALALARAGAHVVALDENPAAIDRLRENAATSGVTAAIDARAENAFDSLRALESEGRRFDLMVIDPPALAKRRSALPAAERAYKELNLRAFRLARPGGIVVTCSCSGKFTLERFGAVVADAARDAGRAVQILERRGAGRDHPPLVGVPETEYLKCWILRVVG